MDEDKEAKRVNDAENASENSNELKKFACEICYFSSKWENGLLIHMTKKHGNIEQLDGIADTAQKLMTKSMKEPDTTGKVVQSV